MICCTRSTAASNRSPDGIRLLAVLVPSLDCAGVEIALVPLELESLEGTRVEIALVPLELESLRVASFVRELRGIEVRLASSFTVQKELQEELAVDGVMDRGGRPRRPGKCPDFAGRARLCKAAFAVSRSCTALLVSRVGASRREGRSLLGNLGCLVSGSGLGKGGKGSSIVCMCTRPCIAIDKAWQKRP